jgi:hypothetical protein
VTLPGRAFAVRYAAGLPAKTIIGHAHAGFFGIRSIPGAYAPPAFTNGLQPSALLAFAGRRIRIGMPMIECGGRLPCSSVLQSCPELNPDWQRLHQPQGGNA